MWVLKSPRIRTGVVLKRDTESDAKIFREWERATRGSEATERRRDIGWGDPEGVSFNGAGGVGDMGRG